MSVIHLGVSGTHSTGKTTIARRVEMELRALGLRVSRISGLAKQASSIGFPKMKSHIGESAEWLIAVGAAQALELSLTADVVIADRTAFDAVAYYLAAARFRGEELSTAEIEVLIQLATLHSRRYEALVVTELDTSIPFSHTKNNDGDYSDAAFRAEVGSQLLWVLDNSGVSFQIIRVSDRQTCVEMCTSRVVDKLRLLQESEVI